MENKPAAGASPGWDLKLLTIPIPVGECLIKKATLEMANETLHLSGAFAREIIDGAHKEAASIIERAKKEALDHSEKQRHDLSEDFSKKCALFFYKWEKQKLFDEQRIIESATRIINHILGEILDELTAMSKINLMLKELSTFYTSVDAQEMTLKFSVVHLEDIQCWRDKHSWYDIKLLPCTGLAADIFTLITDDCEFEIGWSQFKAAIMI
ncbi:HrpE/YscL family type III secretion apparatus protein [Cedecea sp.]|jgi:hypothetical protein|uniref:HrpE/YscL family type III secretion apparatus protein n=1 Tax=Cedecea sp. TaxID=1970739 RepID=UPI002F408A0C